MLYIDNKRTSLQNKSQQSPISFASLKSSKSFEKYVSFNPKYVSQRDENQMVDTSKLCKSQFKMMEIFLGIPIILGIPQFDNGQNRLQKLILVVLINATITICK